MDMKACVSEGAYQMVCFSPDALISNRRWRNMLQEEPVALVMNEAHCVKLWLPCAVSVSPHYIDHT